MLHIKFKYADADSRWEWRDNECYCESVKECKEFYGLDQADVKYQIISVEKAN